MKSRCSHYLKPRGSCTERLQCSSYHPIVLSTPGPRTRHGPRLFSADGIHKASARGHRITEMTGLFPQLPLGSFKHTSSLPLIWKKQCAASKEAGDLQKLSLLPSGRPRRHGETQSGYPQKECSMGSSQRVEKLQTMGLPNSNTGNKTNSFLPFLTSGPILLASKCGAWW